jgi:dTDP-4-dehydrorhamnose reductase
MRPLKPLYASDKSGGLRVVIFGAYGLLGHKLLQTWQELLPTNSTIVGAVRHEWQARALRALPNLITTARVRSGVDALHFETVDALLREERPHIVVNCIVALALPADDAAKVLADFWLLIACNPCQ